MTQAKRPTLPVLVELYLVRCRVEGKSPNTTHAYGETLHRFLRLAEQRRFPNDPGRITAVHLYAYLESFAHLALESRHRYFREVRCFFNWLVVGGYLKETPFRSLRNVRLPQKIVRPYTADDVARLLACCDPSTSIGARDRAIIFTLLDTGIRCSELVQLTLKTSTSKRADFASSTARATSSASRPSPPVAARRSRATWRFGRRSRVLFSAHQAVLGISGLACLSNRTG